MQQLVPLMVPAPGDSWQRFVGDRLRITLRDREGRSPSEGWQAFLRTNLGRAEHLRREILQAHTRGLPLAGESWRDIPMKRDEAGWALEMPLAEVGFFKAKAYLLDPAGWQHWPEGPDFRISVHPDRYRTANILYCAFPRMFGRTKALASTHNENQERVLGPLDESGYTVIPPSGKLRDVIEQLPHIFETLGCSILQLLPVNPVPTTYARFGRFGSPYAALDLTAIDPALVVFDRRTTGIDQFRELTYAAHLHGGRVFLDIVINHTGWGSLLQERHPEWFLRSANGTFVSPGAWGVTWEDLIELEHQNVALWDELAQVFITWCRRGVDGFRCDAGYKVPVPAWQYIVARVQQEYPETIFLLEGLGGAWETTEALLSEGGMQWAYSELFQNYSGAQVASYLEHSIKQSGRAGLLVHFSETHDNDRLAARGRAWSLLRNRLCALASASGGFGFTCGVEWLATEKINVHASTGMNWAHPENLVPELAKLSRLLSEHPCFFDGARITRLSSLDSPVCAMLRTSEEGKDTVLVVVNNDVERSQQFALGTLTCLSPAQEVFFKATAQWVDLLGGPWNGLDTEGPLSPPAATTRQRGELEGEREKHRQIKDGAEAKPVLTLPPAAAYCLAAAPVPAGLSGESYRRARARAAWALQALAYLKPIEELGGFEWTGLASLVDRSPALFLGAVSRLSTAPLLNRDLAHLMDEEGFAPVVQWTRLDARRVTPVPPGHWLLLEDNAPFRAALNIEGEQITENLESITAGKNHIVCFPPRRKAANATLQLELYGGPDRHIEAAIRFLDAKPMLKPAAPRNSDLVLLTNGRGGMGRLRVDLGRVLSKYDCVLGANLHPSLPVDRHIFAKRIRVWVDADGFISPLDFRSLASFDPGPPAVWDFVAPAGDGRSLEIQMMAAMPEGLNTTVFRFRRPTEAQAAGKQLPARADVRLTVRLDIEDRNFHWETRRNGGGEYHFSTHTRPIAASVQNPADIHGAGSKIHSGSDPVTLAGFEFAPAPDRRLRVFASSGCYHPQPEWSENIPHPIEQSRGQVGAGDAFSPGWFDLPMAKGAEVVLVATAEAPDTDAASFKKNAAAAVGSGTLLQAGGQDPFAAKLLRAIRAFVVRRGAGKTVIAGYPWFLDWGRDTFICARGLLAAGLVQEVEQIILTFARFERDGTLPNTIFGEDASNRDTSDAPLWFGLVCEEVAQAYAASGSGESVEMFYNTRVDEKGRSLRQVLESIADHYSRGTPNGICMDPDSGLIWSPAHFTWMDTNYPAGTPREGYPVEIQALWIRLLRQIARIGDSSGRAAVSQIAARAQSALESRFWLEAQGFYSDVLPARRSQLAAQAKADDALRSNNLFLVSLGLVTGQRARRCVEAARRYLIVPGAMRSLAPLPVSVPLPIYSNNGQLLNNPREPYWDRYEGDEDTRRKPAYHNGTAWTWTLPVFCEALARAWDFADEPVAAARAYLGTMAGLMAEGCLGQIPEVLDGDAPHTARGCDAQAWAATEALRVWKLLG
ncbi:MAG TPA: amylo-alpha-1,6-glucosidase [Verrucomicrobiae bacterium]|nr:amylo-alpha-1,6-glucosidase [Verrucomicrobiae bacterium]